MASLPIALFVLFALSLPEGGNGDAPFSPATWVFFWCLLASFSVVVLYPVWFIGRRGQTPGMKISDIRLFQINHEGSLQAPSWKCAWSRSGSAAAC
jgi:uncharacterized RDD family membrane protein YckC